MEKRETGQGNTGTPATHAASRKKGNTPGGQRGGRGDKKGSRDQNPRAASTESCGMRPGYEGLP